MKNTMDRVDIGRSNRTRAGLETARHWRRSMPTTTTMSKLVRIHCGASVATLLVILAAGCAWAPTWPGQTSLASDPPPAARPRSQRVPFDTETACAEVVKAHNRI